MRDKPYSPDEQRVCDYIAVVSNGQIGAGDDPIGFLIASHRYLSQRNQEFIEFLDRGKAEIDECIKIVDKLIAKTP